MAFFLQCPCNRSVKAKFKDRGVTIRADGSVRMSAADLHALRESLMQHWATLGGTCMTGSEDEVWDHVESQLVPSAWSSDCRPIELHVPSLQEQQLYLRRNRPGGAAAAAAASTDASASTAAANAAATQHQQMQQHQQPLPTLSSGARRTPQTPRPQNRSRSRSRGMRLRSRSPRTPEALRQGQQPQAQRDAQDQASASDLMMLMRRALFQLARIMDSLSRLTQHPPQPARQQPAPAPAQHPPQPARRREPDWDNDEDY